MGAARRIDQLAGDAHAAAGLADASLQHVAHAELAADLADVRRLALVGEARIARDHEQRLDAREAGDDVLDHAVGEVFLLRIAAHVLERQDGNRRLVEHATYRCGRRMRGFRRIDRRRRHRAPVGRLPIDTESADRPLYVLERQIAQGVQPRLEAAVDGLAHGAGHDDAARRRFGLQAGGDVHAVTIEVIVIDNQVAEMNAHAEHQAFIFRLVAVGI
jgi:hypothetical protein